MMGDRSSTRDRRLRRALLLTWSGLFAECVTRAFWPLWSLVIAVLGVLMLGVQDRVPVDVVWAGAVITGLLGLVLLLVGLKRMGWPRRSDALERLDATLPGRPLQALSDSQAVGARDDASAALWQAHLGRMARQAAGAKAVRPDLRLASRDPFALRYLATLMLMVALLFGSFWRVGSVSDLTPGRGAAVCGMARPEPLIHGVRPPRIPAAATPPPY